MPSCTNSIVVCENGRELKYISFLMPRSSPRQAVSPPLYVYSGGKQILDVPEHSLSDETKVNELHFWLWKNWKERQLFSALELPSSR